MASKKRGVSTTSSRHSLIRPSSTSTTILPWPSTRVTWWTSILLFIGIFPLQQGFPHLVGCKHGIHRGEPLYGEAVLGQHISHGGFVGIRDEPPAGFARLAVSWADGVTTCAGDGSHADLASSKQAGVLFQLALDTPRVIWDERLFTEPQGLGSGDEFLAVDGASRDNEIHRDHSLNGAHVVCVIPVCLIAIHVPANFIQRMQGLEGMHATQVGAGAKRHD